MIVGVVLTFCLKTKCLANCRAPKSTYLIQQMIFNVLNVAFNQWILERYSFCFLSCSPWTVLGAYSYFYDLLPRP